jgi:hypothetical protein
MATNTCWYLCILGWALRGRSEVCAAVVQAEYGTAQSLTAVYSYSTEGSERGEYCTAAVARLDLVSSADCGNFTRRSSFQSANPTR